MAIELTYHLYTEEKGLKRYIKPFYFRFGACSNFAPAANLDYTSKNSENATTGGSAFDLEIRAFDPGPNMWALDKLYRSGGVTVNRAIGELELNVYFSKPTVQVTYTMEMMRISSAAFRSMPMAMSSASSDFVPTTAANIFFYEACISGKMKSIFFFSPDSGPITQNNESPALAMNEAGDGAVFDEDEVDLIRFNTDEVQLIDDIGPIVSPNMGTESLIGGIDLNL